MLSHQAIETTAEHFAVKLNYSFTRPLLLIQALTRESARGQLVEKDAEYFESLEFVGDRALNMAVANELFTLNKSATPNELNRLYTNFTRNSDPSKRNGGPLYRVAKEIDLEKFIIKSPAEDLAKHGERGRKVGTKKTREGNLSDHVEALIGALYIDSDDGNGKGMVQVVAFVKHFWRHMGLNEECLSESSFGNSIISAAALNIQKQNKQNNIFITSAKAGNWPQALLAFKNGAQIETVDEEQKTALHHFSAWGNCEAVAELIDSGAYLEHKDIQGWTPVLHAAERGKFQALRLLLTEGAAVDIEVVTDNVTVSILTLAAAKNSNEIIYYITINYLYAFSEEQLNFAAMQSKEKNRVHVQTLMQRAIQQKAKCNALFDAVDELIADKHNQAKFNAVKDAISAGVDVRIRNQENNTIFHILSALDMRIELLSFILKIKPKLDGIILNDIEQNIFQVEEFTSDSASKVLAEIETLENISFRHGDLTNFNLKTITKFINVDFMDVILVGVTFHPDVIFVNTNFKGAHVDDELPPTKAMDNATLNSLPEKWKKRLTLTPEQKFALKQTDKQTLFQSPSTPLPSVMSSSSLPITKSVSKIA